MADKMNAPEGKHILQTEPADESVDVVDFCVTKASLGLKPLLSKADKSAPATIDRRNPTVHFIRKRSDSNCSVKEFIKERPKLAKCSSIARLFGNTYSTQQPAHPSEERKSSAGTTTAAKAEKFKKCSETQIEETIDRSAGSDGNSRCKAGKSVCEEKDISGRALRSLSKSLGKLWRRSHSVEISTPDPEYKVLYLGNVLTGWAKGKQLSFYFLLFFPKRIEAKRSEALSNRSIESENKFILFNLVSGSHDSR